MDTFVAGISYKEAGRDERARLSPNEKGRKDLARRIISETGAVGVVVLSTCGRFEVYVEGAEADGVIRSISSALACPELLTRAYVHKNGGCRKHLYSVSAGLLSAVTGEPEILKQVEGAVNEAREAGALSEGLKSLFESALKVAASARSAAGFEPGISIARVAVERAESLSGGIAGKRVYVVGTGPVAKSVAHELRFKGVRPVIAATRNFERALQIAMGICSRPVTIEAMLAELNEADIIFTATSSPHHILTRANAAHALSTGRNVVLVDLALNADIEDSLGSLAGVKLITLDSFTQNSYSEDSILKAREIIERSLQAVY